MPRAAVDHFDDLPRVPFDDLLRRLLQRQVLATFVTARAEIS